jgi:hypothetical protein
MLLPLLLLLLLLCLSMAQSTCSVDRLNCKQSNPACCTEQLLASTEVNTSLLLHTLHLNDVVHKAYNTRQHLRGCCLLLLCLSCKLWVVVEQLQEVRPDDHI